MAAGYDNYTDEAEGSENGILVWDTATGGIVRRLPSSLNAVFDVAFSPDSKLLGCACDNGLLTFDTGEFRHHARVAMGTKHRIAFDSENHFLAIRGWHDVIVWSPSTGREIASLPQPGCQLVSIGDDKVVTSDGRSVRIWNLAAAAERLELTGHSSACNALAFTPDGKFLVSGKQLADDAKLWNLSTHKAVKRWRVAGAEWIAFSPDGRLMATGGFHGDAPQIWDTRTHESLVAPEHEIGPQPQHGINRIAIFCVAFSRDGRYFAASGNGMALWELESQAASDGSLNVALTPLIELPGRQSLHVCFSPDNRLVAWVNRHHQVRIWNIAEAREIPFGGAQLLDGWEGITFHPDSDHLLYIDREGSAGVWNTATGERVAAITPPGAFQRSTVALSPDGRFLVGRETTSRLALWDMKSRKRRFAFREERCDISSTAWSPDSRRLAVGLFDGGISVWDVAKIEAELAELSLD